jgi:hypothetical protein
MPKPETTKDTPMPVASTSISLVATGIAGKKLVESVVADLYNLAKNELGQQVKKWKATNHADTIYKRVRQLRLVKTIWQIEKELDLTTFYHPTKVIIGGKRQTVHQIADFGYDGNILIEGTVGQGKSIFLRYLASVDFCLSRRIPVFIELRRLRQGQTLIAFALQELKALGFDMTDELFHFFAEKGRLVLFLDAFDEVKEELRQDVTAELENLLRQHEAFRAVVTSRPDNGIASSPALRVFRLSPLEGREYEAVVHRMANNTEIADAIIHGIRKDAAQIARVLTTPLMVALLMVRFKIDQSLPQNDAAFYDALFTLLLQRHDKSKGGYVRPRKSGLDDTVLLDFFNALCFVTRKANETSFSRPELTAFGREALSGLGHTASIDKILEDIVKITCLILVDGEECRFIHKSVQEYHAALFIKDQPQESAISFYSGMSERWGQWFQELRFLGAIDRYRYLKFFHIPQVRKLLRVESELPNQYEAGNNLIVEICGEDKVEIGASTKSITFHSTGRHWPASRLLHEGIDYTEAIFQLSKKDFAEQPNSQKYQFTVSQLLNLEASRDTTQKACAKLFKALFEDLKNSEIYVSHVENRKAIFQF